MRPSDSQRTSTARAEHTPDDATQGSEAGGQPAGSLSASRGQAGDAVPWAVRAAAAWSWRVALIAGVATGLLYVLWVFRLVTVPVFVALLLTALLEPAVGRLHRVGMPRPLAVVLVIVGFIAALGGIFVWLAGLVRAGLGDVGTAASLGLDQVRRWLQAGPLNVEFGQLDELTANIQQTLRDNLQRITQGALTTVRVLTQLLAGLLLALVLSVFFLYDGSGIWRWVVRLFPRNVEDRVDGAGRRGWETLAGYVQGIVHLEAGGLQRADRGLPA